jgi:hypothetical protein
MRESQRHRRGRERAGQIPAKYSKSAMPALSPHLTAPSSLIGDPIRLHIPGITFLMIPAWRTGSRLTDCTQFGSQLALINALA